MLSDEIKSNLIIPTVKILEDAKALISSPDNWCKEVSAQDKFGEMVSPLDDAACKFCMMGAIEHVINHVFTNYNTAQDFHDLLRNSLGGTNSIGPFNDRSTHEEVMNAFDTMINHLKEYPNEYW